MIVRNQQRLLEAFTAGAEDVSCYRDILADVEIGLYAFDAGGVVFHGVGVAGHLFAAAAIQIKSLFELKLIIGMVGFFQLCGQQKLQSFNWFCFHLCQN